MSCWILAAICQFVLKTGSLLGLVLPWVLAFILSTLSAYFLYRYGISMFVGS